MTNDILVLEPDAGITWAIIATKTIVLILGGVITYFSYKAYKRTDAGPLRALAIGFGVITLGSLLAGIIHTIIGVDLEIGVLINSLVSALGFAIITYSLYIE